ncbi:MAG TPA: YncE family protein [Terriglobales bacterium]|nr:YncE family protein [Terriglobales bacterium]
MKRAVSFVPVLLLSILFAACGAGTPPSQEPTTSQLSNRALVANQFSSVVNIMNGDNDTVSTFTVPAGTNPSMIVVSPDKRFSAIFNSFDNTLSIINNAEEFRLGTVSLGAFSESMAFSPDGNKLYAAVRNAAAVVILTIAADNTATSTSVTIPAARRLVVSGNGNRVLVFSDGLDTVSVIDATNSNAITTVAGFDRPTWAVFSNDNATAWVLNCGPECGGTQASIVALDMGTLTLGTPVPVPAATIGLLSGSQLWVAGTEPGALCNAGTTFSACGKLTALNVPALTLATPAGGVDIVDGFHHAMEMGTNNKLFIASRTCRNLSEGCLSIVNTSNNSVVVSVADGDVTGLAAIPGRDVVYVAEGGELRIYDTSTSALQSRQVDFVGHIADVKSID